MNRLTLKFFPLFLLLTALGESFAGAQSVIEKQAEAMFSGPDSSFIIQKAIPFAYSHFGDDRLTELIKSIWNLDQKKYPNLAWESLKDDEVRLRIASLWAQWIRETQKDKTQLEPIRNFVRPYLKHSNPEIRMTAAAFPVYDNADVQKLKEIILHDERVIAGVATFTIVNIQGSCAQDTLSQLLKLVKDTWLKDVITRAIAQAASARYPEVNCKKLNDKK